MPTFEELTYAPFLKLERAAHHITNFSAECDAFLAEHPFQLMVHHYRRAGRRVFRVEKQKPVPPILFDDW